MLRLRVGGNNLNLKKLVGSVIVFPTIIAITFMILFPLATFASVTYDSSVFEGSGADPTASQNSKAVEVAPNYTNVGYIVLTISGNKYAEVVFANSKITVSNNSVSTADGTAFYRVLDGGAVESKYSGYVYPSGWVLTELTVPEEIVEEPPNEPTDPVDPAEPTADTELLQAIEDRLENLEGIQKDQFSLLHDLGYIALGTLIGLVAFHLLFREVLKW